MNSQRIKTIAILAAIIPAICFFLPWASIEIRNATSIKNFLGMMGEAERIKISGYDIPCMANNGNARAIQKVLTIFVSDAENADKKSYLVWLVPLLAILLAGLTFPAARNRKLALAVGAAGILIFLAGTIKILTADLNPAGAIVHISPGFWLTLLSYLALGIVNIQQHMRPRPLT